MLVQPQDLSLILTLPDMQACHDLPSTSSDLFDSLQRYLAEPLVSEQEIPDAGGLLAYLESQHTQQLCLTQFQLDVLTALS